MMRGWQAVAGPSLAVTRIPEEQKDRADDTSYRRGNRIATAAQWYEHAYRVTMSISSACMLIQYTKPPKYGSDENKCQPITSLPSFEHSLGAPHLHIQPIMSSCPGSFLNQHSDRAANINIKAVILTAQSRAFIQLLHASIYFTYSLMTSWIELDGYPATVPDYHIKL